jgi:hypothetical protein
MSSEAKLKSELVKLAHDVPALRKHLLPILRDKTAATKVVGVMPSSNLTLNEDGSVALTINLKSGSAQAIQRLRRAAAQRKMGFVADPSSPNTFQVTAPSSHALPEDESAEK